MRPLGVSVVLLSTLLGGCTVGAPLTAAQGEAILAELRAIRAELERSGAARPAPAAPRERPARATLEVVDGPALGAADAPVVLVEFTDLQCPFCRRHHEQTWPRIRREFVDTGRVRYFARDLPLGFHEQAEPAALALRCAAEQGRYWEYRDAVFDRQARLEDALYRMLAAELSLDLGRFDECLATRRHAAAIAADAQAAAAAGLTGTPAFVIGRIVNGRIDGEVLTGAQPFSTFSARLEAALAAAGTTAPSR
jgi:protein-disulfide isomerase